MTISVRPTTTRGEEQLSLDIYNEVWPMDAVTVDEVESYKRGAIAYGDHLAWLDGALAGSASVAVVPARPEVASALVTVQASTADDLRLDPSAAPRPTPAGPRRRSGRRLDRG